MVMLLGVSTHRGPIYFISNGIRLPVVLFLVKSVNLARGCSLSNRVYGLYPKKIQGFFRIFYIFSVFSDFFRFFGFFRFFRIFSFFWVYEDFMIKKGFKH